MPTHPTEACYCHVIEAGLANIERHYRRGATDELANELEHIRAVTEILTAVLLYPPSDPRHDESIHDRYWDWIRPRFIARANSDSVRQHIDAWEFLALATRGTEFRDSLPNNSATGNA